tara:strand:+ start:139 stop:606 length:468 start_codon:yes stop_codon:yes gene_type:complete
MSYADVMGAIGENAVANYLGEGWRRADSSEREQIMGDVLPVGELRAGIEVKTDVKSFKTGRVAFEVKKVTPKGYVDSGINWTKANLVVYVLPEINSSWTALVYETSTLRKLLADVTDYRMGGDRDAALLALVTRETAERWAMDIVPNVIPTAGRG